MNNISKKDVWHYLKKHTDARIAQGRTGNSLPTNALLDFNLSHALARDAIYENFQVETLQKQLENLKLNAQIVHSKAKDKATYLLNPNFGRELCEESKIKIHTLNENEKDICIIISDGLSATAANSHSLSVIQAIQNEFLNTAYTFSNIVLVRQGRVAISDEIGELMKCRFSVLLIGERPGLSFPDSLGIYLTYNPRVGRTDAERNCISNIRPQGLSYKEAAYKLKWLILEADKIKATGVLLKDESSERKKISE